MSRDLGVEVLLHRLIRLYVFIVIPWIHVRHGTSKIYKSLILGDYTYILNG